jgi:uncharacterized RDD family membrane protein YckC
VTEQSWQRRQLAGFWLRAVAVLVDAVVALVVFATLVLLTRPVLETLLGEAPALGMVVGIAVGVLAVAGLLYDVLMTAGAGGTLGKRATGVEVRAGNGHRLETGRALGRFLGRLLSTVVVLLGLLWVAGDPRKQGWHDKLTQTVVVKRRHLPWMLREPEAPLWATAVQEALPAGAPVAPVEGDATPVEGDATPVEGDATPVAHAGHQADRAVPTARSAGAPPVGEPATPAGAWAPSAASDTADAAETAPVKGAAFEAARVPGEFDEDRFEAEASHLETGGRAPAGEAFEAGTETAEPEPARPLAVDSDAAEDALAVTEGVADSEPASGSTPDAFETSSQEAAAAGGAAPRESQPQPARPEASAFRELFDDAPSGTAAAGPAPTAAAAGPAPTAEVSAQPEASPPHPDAGDVEAPAAGGGALAAHEAEAGAEADEETDPNLAAIERAGLAEAAAGWLRQVAAQVDPRLDQVSPAWREREQAPAARACAFGLLLGHLATLYPHMADDLHAVAEAHPSFSTLMAGSRLSTLQQIAGDRPRAAAWLGPLLDVSDEDRLARLLQ